VRTIVRKTDAPKAKKYQSKGAELVVADLTNKEQLKKAFKGAYGLFAMTPVEASNHYELGKNQADAAREEGIKHLIWSGLEDAEQITKGELRLPGFTQLAKVEEYIRAMPNRGFNFTTVELAFFYSNLLQYWRPTKNPDGSLTFKLPVGGNTKLPHQDPVTSVGPVVLSIFSSPEKYSDRVIPIVTEEISPNEMVATFSKVSGVPATFKTATKEEFGKDWEMFYFSEKYGYYRKDRDLQEGRKLSPNARNWEQFLRDTQWKGESWEEFIQRNPEYA
jgi:uncharacterized protein YbjT (DUF2867 family)